ncbi:MAG: hypothetical protein ACOH17_13325 [Cellulomonas sp.]
MTRSSYLDFRSFDAADATLDTSQQQRADALLERIIAAPVPHNATARVGAPPQRRVTRKVIWVPAVAAVVVGSIVLPVLGGSGTAYASWTATPSAIAGSDLQAVTQACRAKLGGYARVGQAGFEAASVPVALAERRGDFVAVLFHQDNPDVSASCVATNRPGSSSVEDVHTGLSGSSGPAITPALGQFTQGGISQFGDHPVASMTDGAVGADVVGVTIHAGDIIVVATVKNGRYAAWWPGKAFADGPRQPSGRGGPEPILTYDVTLADGTIKTSVDPALPQ